jgi:hypothetical protein
MKALETINIDFSNCSEQTKIQIKTIYNLIQRSSAYATYHYNKALFWLWMYWVGGISTIIVTSILTVINSVYYYNSCENFQDTTVKTVNIVSSGLITTVIGVFTFLNPTERRRDREDAADRFHTLVNDIKKDVFFSGEPVASEYTIKLIEKYTTKFNDYIDFYYEPPVKEIEKIIKESGSDINIIF